MTQQLPPPRKRRRLLRRLTLGFVVSVLLPGLAYLWLAYDYSTKKPAPFVDVYAELNARNEAFDESQKAWTVYFDAQYNHWYHARSEIEDAKWAFQSAEGDQMMYDPRYEPQDDPFTSTHNQFGIPPEHELYGRVLETVEQLQPQIEAVRTAAQRPVFGTPVIDVPNEQGFIEFVPEWYPESPAVDPLDSRPISEAFLYQIGVSASMQKLLTLDARVALDAGDARRAASDMRAMLGIARQTASEPTLIAPSVALSNQRATCELITRSLDEVADDDGRSEIIALLPDLIHARDHPIRVDFEDVRLTYLDLIGRVYSDDGKGDGIVTIDGMRMMQDLASEEQSSPTKLAFAWPMQKRFATKSEAIDQLDTVITAAESLQEAGPSSTPDFVEVRKEVELREDGQQRSLFEFSYLALSWQDAAYSEVRTSTTLEATIARLALERHRIETGAYPDTFAQLVPEYLDRLPQDPFDPGQPLRYLLLDGTPHIYSVGSDGDDDLAALPNDDRAPERVHYFEYRFPHPDHPTYPAPDADWVIWPPDR